MDWITNAERFLTLVQVAIYVGCPVGGATYLIGRVIITQAAKQATRLGVLSVSTGVLATFCAALLLGNKNQENTATPTQAPPGVPIELLLKRDCLIELKSIATDSLELTLDGITVTRQDMTEKLLLRLTQGNLNHVTVKFSVPQQQHGDWWLYLTVELRDFVSAVKRSSEFQVITAETDTND